MISAKYTALVAGCFQQTFLVLLIRYSKTRMSDGNDDPSAVYLTSVAVASAELFKLCLSCSLELITNKPANQNAEESKLLVVGSDPIPDTKDRVPHVLKVLKQLLKFNTIESFKLIIPAVLYLIQNNLLFVALANLSVPMYQVTSQGKLLTTAIISRILLKKQMNNMQYLSIVLLGFGVAFIHLAEFRHHQQVSSGEEDASKAVQSQLLGLIAVFFCCCTSGFAGVYFEFVLKKEAGEKNLSIHYRNFHLSFWSLTCAIIGILASSKDMEKVRAYGVFHGFNALVVFVVIMQGTTGFICSLMIKYADTILKGFAVAVAAVLATVLSIPLFGAEVQWTFAVGASIVLGAVRMYGHYSLSPEQRSASSSSVGALSYLQNKKIMFFLVLILCLMFSSLHAQSGLDQSLS